MEDEQRAQTPLFVLGPPNNQPRAFAGFTRVTGAVNGLPMRDLTI